MKNANPVSRRSWRSLLVLGTLVALCMTGCDREVPSNPTPKTVADRFEIKVGNKLVRLQLAVNENEMTVGLMGRKDLGRDEGMLFVFNRPQRMSFWMHNTPTPLDIGYFDASGRLKEIYPMQPFDETTVSSRSSELSLALEMNQGWFHENEIKPGAQLDMKALVRAMKARGFEPARFGLEP